MMHFFEPRLVNEAFGDPGLYIDFRDERRALLFDLGDITVLPPRKLLRLSHVFVTHTHMDHFAGFDHLLRVVLGRKDRIALYGGPGFVDQVEHKLRAYTWNVVHRYEVELAIEAREIFLTIRKLGASVTACICLIADRQSDQRDFAQSDADVGDVHKARRVRSTRCALRRCRWR